MINHLTSPSSIIDHRASFQHTDALLNIPPQPPPTHHCNCSISSNCLNDECTCPQLYTHNGILLSLITEKCNDQIEEPLYECNSSCSCSEDCNNRIVQKVSAVPVKIFDTGDRGWGLRTLVDISKGKFVMEYTGELVSSKIAKERSEKYDKAGLNYLLVVKEHCGDLCLRTNIDATFQGNAARYINHSCSPNLQPVLVRINTIVPHIGFFASQDIQKNEELTFSYGDATEGIHPCLCGSALCKGFLPYEQ